MPPSLLFGEPSRAELCPFKKRAHTSLKIFFETNIYFLSKQEKQEKTRKSTLIKLETQISSLIKVLLRIFFLFVSENSIEKASKTCFKSFQAPSLPK